MDMVMCVNGSTKRGVVGSFTPTEEMLFTPPLLEILLILHNVHNLKRRRVLGVCRVWRLHAQPDHIR